MLTVQAALLAQEEEGPNPLLPHLSELIVGVVAFGILLFVLWKFVFPTFERTYAERTAAIEGGIKEAEEKQAEAQRALDEYRQQLASAREEAAQIRADAQRQGQEIIAEMREQAQAEADRITSRAQAQLAAEREQVIRSLRTEVGSLATELAGRVVGESLADDARSQRVVERFLAELESGNGADSRVGSSNGGT
ncbi:MAG: F0F1 ATP synthase subunit B [Actinomycetota bacterium]